MKFKISSHRLRLAFMITTWLVVVSGIAALALIYLTFSGPLSGTVENQTSVPVLGKLDTTTYGRVLEHMEARQKLPYAAGGSANAFGSGSAPANSRPPSIKLSQ